MIPEEGPYVVVDASVSLKWALDDEENTFDRKDRQALVLLAEAQRQYERYRELREIAEAAGQQEPAAAPVPNWQTPLTLVFRSSAK